MVDKSLRTVLINEGDQWVKKGGLRKRSEAERVLKDEVLVHKPNLKYF